MEDWSARVTDKRGPGGADLVLDSAIVEGGEYAGLRLSRFVSIGSRFSSCRFDSMRIAMMSAGAGLRQSEYIRCSFNGTRMDMQPGGFARFVDCSFRDTVITHWSVPAGDMIDCVFSGTIRTAIFNGTVDPRLQKDFGRVRNDFHGNDFSQAEMVDVSFRTGIDLRRQILRCGPGYCYVECGAASLEGAYAIVARWEDGELRRAATSFLDRLQELVQRGQQQLFIQRATGRNARFWPQICAALHGER